MPRGPAPCSASVSRWCTFFASPLPPLYGPVAQAWMSPPVLPMSCFAYLAACFAIPHSVNALRLPPYHHRRAHRQHHCLNGRACFLPRRSPSVKQEYTRDGDVVANDRAHPANQVRVPVIVCMIFILHVLHRRRQVRRAGQCNLSHSFPGCGGPCQLRAPIQMHHAWTNNHGFAEGFVCLYVCRITHAVAEEE